VEEHYPILGSLQWLRWYGCHIQSGTRLKNTVAYRHIVKGITANQIDSVDYKEKKRIE
jgi:hypothetical protein